MCRELFSLFLTEHLIDLESGLAERNAVLQASQTEMRRLKEENDERESFCSLRTSRFMLVDIVD